MAISYPNRTNVNGIWKLSDITKNIKTEGTWPKGSTTALYAGGQTPSDSNVIDTIIIETTGDASDFGNLTAARSGASRMSSFTRALFGGGYPGSAVVNTVDYVQIKSAGNAADFGDLSAARGYIGDTGLGNDTRGMVTVGDGIGIGGSFAQLTDLQGSTDHSITYTDTPESMIDGSKFRSTGAITTQAATHMAASAMFTQGPIHAQGEYFKQQLDVSDTVERNFSGYYAQGGYFITGESRTWDQRHATWDAVKPNGKWAIEVAGRYSMQDYTDGTAVTGGEQKAITGAVNLYSGPAKIGFNITKVEHDTANVGDDHTFIGVRTQLAF